ncbi:hypothetical protein BC628DRAFT_1474549 [Trametes gibbosa]|nr:hypothetical protein BC628DRAFT_1474549 [Trametes gibbosa]
MPSFLWAARILCSAAWSMWRCFPSSFRLATYRWLHNRYGDKRYNLRVAMLPFGIVIKGVRGSPHYETENIRFVAKHTSVPVPRILDVVECTVTSSILPPARSEVIVTTRLQGDPLAGWVADRAIHPPGQLELPEQLQDSVTSNGETDDITRGRLQRHGRAHPVQPRRVGQAHRAFRRSPDVQGRGVC